MKALPPWCHNWGDPGEPPYIKAWDPPRLPREFPTLSSPLVPA